MGGVSAAVSKTAAAPIERVKLLIQNQVCWPSPSDAFTGSNQRCAQTRVRSQTEAWMKRSLAAMEGSDLTDVRESKQGKEGRWQLDQVVLAADPLNDIGRDRWPTPTESTGSLCCQRMRRLPVNSRQDGHFRNRLGSSDLPTTFVTTTEAQGGSREVTRHCLRFSGRSENSCFSALATLNSLG